MTEAEIDIARNAAAYLTDAFAALALGDIVEARRSIAKMWHADWYPEWYHASARCCPEVLFLPIFTALARNNVKKAYVAIARLGEIILPWAEMRGSDVHAEPSRGI